MALLPCEDSREVEMRPELHARWHCWPAGWHGSASCTSSPLSFCWFKMLNPSEEDPPFSEGHTWNCFLPNKMASGGRSSRQRWAGKQDPVRKLHKLSDSATYGHPAPDVACITPLQHFSFHVRNLKLISTPCLCANIELIFPYYLTDCSLLIVLQLSFSPSWPKSR